MYWTRRALAEWLVALLSDGAPTLAGIDRGFSFPLEYFDRHGLARDWRTSLEDFERHWRTDRDDVWVRDLRNAPRGEQRNKVAGFLDSASKDDFTEKLLVPLFQRLGFHRVTPSGHNRKDPGVRQGSLDEISAADWPLAVFLRSDQARKDRRRRGQQQQRGKRPHAEYGWRSTIRSSIQKPTGKCYSTTFS